jgi:general secretion pathway protein L
MILLRLAPVPCWQRFEAGQMVAAGDGWPVGGGALVVAVPGEAVALHWLDLPDLAPAQAAAAARLMLGDALAEADPHVVVAPGAGLRPVAVVAHAAMAGWLAELAGAGVQASALVPEPLLLPAPVQGWSVMAGDGRVIARGVNAGFSAEATLAELLIDPAPTSATHLTLPDPLPLNLLSGDYAPVTRWQPAPGLARRAGLLAATLLGLWVAGDVAGLLQAQRTASAADAATLALARPLLPAGAPDGAVALTQLQALARTRGADGGLAGVAGPLTAALAARPGSGLASLGWTPAGGLVVGVAGGESEARALAETLSDTGLSARTGLTRASADGSVTDVVVQRQ